MANGTTVFPTALDHNAVKDNEDEITSTDQNDRAVQIEALEAKVGIDGSAVTTSHDYKLSLITGTSKAAVQLVGEIKIWPLVIAPTGWLVCDGSAISRTTYASLFAVLDITYGAGDTTSTFNLPNFKGKVPVGLDAAQTEFDSISETGGAKTHTLATSEMPSHNHDVIDPQHRHDIIDVYHVHNNVNYTGTGQNPLEADGANQDLQTALASTGISIDNTGGGGAHNNLQPYITIQYIIKT